jgi:ribonucleotide reductase beta subunit family protein with ferritin-like domain
MTEERVFFRPFNYPWAFEAWLKHEQIHWLHTEVPMADDINDWKNHLSNSEKKFLTHIFRFFTQGDIDVAGGYVDNYLPFFKQPEIRMMLLGFAARECFDDKTEVLTDSGWKFFDNISEKDLVAQMDIENRNITFEKPIDFIKREYCGDMHLYENKRTSICVTPNHRICLINPHTRKMSLKESSSGKWGRNFLYPVNGICNKDDSLTTMERLLIAIAADGTIRGNCQSYKNSNTRCNDMTVDIHIKKQRKINRIIQFLREIGVNCHERKKESGISIFTFSLSGLIDKNVLYDVKKLSFINEKEIGTKKADEFIEELLFWDGSVSGNKTWYSTNIDAVNKVQSISLFSKYGCSIGVNRKSSSDVVILQKKVKKPTKECYALTFSEETERSYPHRKIIPYNGNVYCVTMPKGTVVTRRNKKVSIQGNCMHIAAYSHLIETLGLPQETYNEFMQYTEMKNKHDFVSDISLKGGSKQDTARHIAVFSAFTEGMQLFSSFIMLLNFPRNGKMKGMGKIVTWSIIDETIHCQSMIKLFKTYIKENREIWNDELKSSIYTIAEKMVHLEDNFIDLAFGIDKMEGLTKEEVKKYIRYIADRRLIELGMKGIFKVKKNPLPWVEEMINAPIHTNFFEDRSTDYAKGSLSGGWEDVWANKN